ncbi:hypothetical protein HYR99_11075 [Candidatus Poribacteria bacterium]|nr:hypothetical protein [Candidatus Poribacteria bacterium]
MDEMELHTLDQRFGKFEGVQQQHDQRLAEIEQRLRTIEVLITDVRTEGHREREALRAELSGKMDGIRTELLNQINGNRNELNGRIDSLRAELIGQMDSLRAELNGRIDKLSDRIDKLSDKIDGLYKWFIGILIAVGASVIAAILRGFFQG